MKTIALVGQPNVGKSSLLNCLAGRVSTVSNYPGTTVETQAATMCYGPFMATLIDTPGTYSLNSLTPEQQVTASVIRHGVDIILNVVEVTDLERQLRLTAELSRERIPMVIALNQSDAVEGAGSIARMLEEELGCPVIPTSATSGMGLVALKNALLRGGRRPRWCDGAPCIVGPSRREGLLDKLLDRPLTGVPLLAVTGYLLLKTVILGISLFEGIVAAIAGMLISWLEVSLASMLEPGFVKETLPGALGDGILVPLGIVLPSMLAVYLFMAAMEDSGLLARYAVILDRFLNLIGLPGNAFIPLCLALGCRVPALLALRTIRDSGDRFVTGALVGVVVPCAASLGMVTAVVARFGGNIGAVYATWLAGFVLIPFLTGSGPRGSCLALEVPPLRIPRPVSVASKTEARLRPFFLHVLPLLVMVSVGVRFLIAVGICQVTPVDRFSLDLMGIKGEVLLGVALTSIQRYLAPAVLLGMPLSPREATIASAMVALGFPCLPASLVTLKELGAKALAFLFILGTALPLLTGVVLNAVLPGGAP